MPDIPTIIIIGGLALLTMNLVRGINKLFDGLASLSASKVLTESRDATYYKGKGSPREPIPKDTVIAIFERDGGKCVHCGAKCYLGSRRPQDVSNGLRKAYFGHWIANSWGGGEDKDNIHISCDDCNNEMGSNLILAPAIRYAANRKETICTEGLEIAGDCETIIEYIQKQRVAA